MARDYIIFIHGVNTRQDRDQEGYSKPLFEKIKENAIKKPEAIELYWGDVNKDEETRLVNMWENSRSWDALWFRKFRKYQMLQFVGDAALYISRAVGYKMIEKLCQQLQDRLAEASDEDHLHIVAHSWGTVILFDILFASRWDEIRQVHDIREKFFGIPINSEIDPAVNLKHSGYKIASIHTMGCPISVYQLMRIDIANTHEISTRLKDFIGLDSARKTITWNNYIYPGDPVGYPLEKQLPVLLNITNGDQIIISDIILSLSFISRFLTYPFSQTSLALLLYGGKAHGKYWRSKAVAQSIAKSLNSSG